MKAKLKPLTLVVKERKVSASPLSNSVGEGPGVRSPIRIDHRTVIYVCPDLTPSQLQTIIKRYTKQK